MMALVLALVVTAGVFRAGLGAKRHEELGGEATLALLVALVAAGCLWADLRARRQGCQ